MDKVIDLANVGPDARAEVGGKATNLAEMARIAGIHVPDAFCVSTSAFTAGRGVAPDVADAIEARLARFPADATFAVRSSATAEDSPHASFAGLFDSFLNVARDEVVAHVVKCWESASSELAGAYRRENALDEHELRMGVIVQRMVNADAAGVLFTADPVSGNRKACVIEAVAGLGDRFVSGMVNAERWTVRDSEVDGSGRTLTVEQVAELAALGRRIEAHFGAPQDIEWCLADGQFEFVQSRPITTLYPVPPVDDDQPHVYISVGHQQMMTDAMRPLGVSVFQLTALRPMVEAGGRLFVDVTGVLRIPAAREGFLAMLGASDPLIRDALETLIQREFVPSVDVAPPPSSAPATPEVEPDPAIVTSLIEETMDATRTLEQDITALSGSELFDFILEDIARLKAQLSDPQSTLAVMTGINATTWLNMHLELWLGETNAADVLAQSVPNNVTSQMGLALLDIAILAFAHPSVVTVLREADDRFMEKLEEVDGGPEVRASIETFLQRYGMRGVGEIDVTRPRWGERPNLLVPMILALEQSTDQTSQQRFEAGKHAAEQRQADLLQRLRELPDGEQKARETKTMIDRLRAFIGYREFPKYAMIARFDAYKRALMREAADWVASGLLDSAEQAWFLRFEELHELARGGPADLSLIHQREQEFRRFQKLMPCRVMTSDGEGIPGSYHRELPPGALAGLGVSAGVVEGRARVIVDVADAALKAGDILVTRFTDPSWTPVFVAIGGLVTEVGGMMTHGAVIAREYGLPAVVGVDRATERITDGQRIRVDGARGTVELI